MPAQSGLVKLSFGSNSAEELPGHLAPSSHPHLEYLSLRRAKLSGAALQQLLALYTGPAPGQTLVLDAIKLSGTGTLKNMLGQSGSFSEHF